MLTLILAMSIGAEPQQTFTVINKCGQRFSVTNKCQTITPTVVVQSPAPIVRQSVGDGHTHTCANGHTWNHATNPTHNCQVCGLPQYVQDSTPRAVSQQNYQAPTYSSQLGGCANGQCQSYSPTQTQMSNSGGWYLGKNLRGR